MKRDQTHCSCGGRLLLVDRWLVCENGCGRLIGATRDEQLRMKKNGLEIVQNPDQRQIGLFLEKL